MSATAMGMALEVAGTSPRAKIVLIAICNSANEYTFEGYPGRKDLARVADCSLDTIDRCIRELTDMGFLEKTGRDRDDGKGRTSNLYRVFPAHDPSRKSAATPPPPAAMMRPVGNADLRLPQPHKLAATLAAYCAAPKEPLSEPLEESVVEVRPRATISKVMIEEAQARADGAINLTSGSVHQGSVFRALLAAGCEWQDILDAIDAITGSFRAKGQRFHSWVILNDAAMAIRDRRVTGLPCAPAVIGGKRPNRESMSDIIDRVFAEEEAKRVG